MTIPHPKIEYSLLETKSAYSPSGLHFFKNQLCANNLTQGINRFQQHYQEVSRKDRKISNIFSQHSKNDPILLSCLLLDYLADRQPPNEEELIENQRDLIIAAKKFRLELPVVRPLESFFTLESYLKFSTFLLYSLSIKEENKDKIQTTLGTHFTNPQIAEIQDLLHRTLCMLDLMYASMETLNQISDDVYLNCQILSTVLGYIVGLSILSVCIALMFTFMMTVPVGILITGMLVSSALCLSGGIGTAYLTPYFASKEIKQYEKNFIDDDLRTAKDAIFGNSGIHSYLECLTHHPKPNHSDSNDLASEIILGIYEKILDPTIKEFRQTTHQLIK